MLKGITSESEFAEKLNRYLSPAKPIDTIQFLHGRSAQLRQIEKALYAPGRNIFIYGDRGVGKSSLAQTAAVQYQSSDNEFILVECGRSTTFRQVMEAIARKTVERPSQTIEKIHRTSLSTKLLSYEFTKHTTTNKQAISVDSMDAASDLMKDIATLHSERPIVVIDEFDAITDENERNLFAEFLKQIGDKSIGIKFILSGIGSSLERLLGAHLSSIRQLETIELGRLSWDARWEIINDVANVFGVEVSKEILIRIAGISDGFPYYVHLLAEKMFWRLFESSEIHDSISIETYYASVSDAVKGISPHLRRPYDEATKNRPVEFHHILWAAADAYDLQRRTENIFNSYIRIMEEIKQIPLEKDKFLRRLGSLKKDDYGEILCSIPKRTGWYQFSENMVRGFVRLVAEDHGVTLAAEVADAPPMPTAQVRRMTPRHVYRKPYVPPISFGKKRNV